MNSSIGSNTPVEPLVVVVATDSRAGTCIWCLLGIVVVSAMHTQHAEGTSLPCGRSGITLPPATKVIDCMLTTQP